MERIMEENNLDYAKEMVKIAVAALDEKKGEDIRIIDISDVTVIADYFIIATGSNINQVQALVDNVQEALFKAGHETSKIEGYHTGAWVLLDYNHIIIHVFSKEDRLFYDLERIWRDGKTVDVASL
ncbi:ribosome silencing factor [[Clostridium] fimetarium]|nr:ribosome silencing factor [[Clostridium] fimetarium]